MTLSNSPLYARQLTHVASTSQTPYIEYRRDVHLKKITCCCTPSQSCETSRYLKPLLRRVCSFRSSAKGSKGNCPDMASCNTRVILGVNPKAWKCRCVSFLKKLKTICVCLWQFGLKHWSFFGLRNAVRESVKSFCFEVHN